MDCVPKSASHLYRSRQIVSALIITGSLDHIDSTCLDKPALASEIFRDALSMATAAMAAPGPDAR
jgi:hypothetical protein